jgi:hypothetical protein
MKGSKWPRTRMKSVFACVFAVNTLRAKKYIPVHHPVYERGFSFFSLNRAMRATPETCAASHAITSTASKRHLTRTQMKGAMITLISCDKENLWHTENLIRSLYVCSTAARSLMIGMRYNFKQAQTFTILKRTPGMSPFAWPWRPKPATKTSSFSSTKFRQPSLGTKAAIFLPFLMSCTRTHLRTAEFGCLDSIPIFSRTIPLA